MASRAPTADQAIGQAPGSLNVVQSFVNTKDVEEATDELASAGGLAAWLGTSGLLDGGGDRHAGERRSQARG